MKNVVSENKIIYKIDSNLQSILSQKYDFHVLVLPGLPILFSAVNVACTSRLESHYPDKGIKMLATLFENHCDHSRWFLDKEEYLKLGKKVFADKKFIKKTEDDFKNNSRKFYKFIEILEKNGIVQESLEKDFLRFIDLYLSQFGIIYAITGPITYGFSDYYLANFLKKYKYSGLAQNAIKIFTKSHENFIREEEEKLRKIKNEITESRIKLSTLDNLKKKHRIIYNLLSNHQQKYYWISNNYKDVKKLKINHFFKRLKNIAGVKEIKNAKSNSDAKQFYGKIRKVDIESLKLLGEMAGFQDLRKKSNVIANYWIMEFLKAVARKYKINFSLLTSLILLEVVELLKTGKINVKKLQERKKGMINFTFQNKEYVLTGKDFAIAARKLDKITEKKNSSILKGITANQGTVVGTARVVINIAKNGKKIKKGDILVTSMTRPEFAPYLKIVKGIITNEGGITSHAAVISRELDIPCIIATKNATSVLKDGDLVEVDADKGIVKILKRKNNH